MKRILVSVVISVLLCVSIIPQYASAVTTALPKRVISLVYDDSGSMIIDDENKNVDTWCQAKYAMEVFSAMLSENDTMNVYTMSDFNSKASGKPRLSLNGSDGSDKNVSKIHNMITTAQGTPFATVRQAYLDLNNTSADEKWLVVLTDGAFQGIDSVDDYFAKKSQDISVMFLSMGKYAQGIKPDESNNIFYEKAQTNDEILNKITDISTRIFNSNKLKIDTSSNKISFDIPMSELIVFVQGANTSIKGIKDSKNNIVSPSSNPVDVKYSEKPADNYKDFLVNKNLQGSIATFKNSFDAGEYSIETTNAKTIEVYYKPDIEIVAYLKDSNNNEIKDLSNIQAGEYTIEFDFAKSGTNVKLPKSTLLGDVSYSSKITNNSKKLEGTYSSGDKIQVEEGSLEIDVEGTYLKYNTVSTHIKYDVFVDKNLEFKQINSPVYELNSNGLNCKEPITIKTSVNGKEFTEEQRKFVLKMHKKENKVLMPLTLIQQTSMQLRLKPWQNKMMPLLSLL